MIIDKNKFLLTPMTLLWNRNQEYDFCLYISNNMQGYFLEFGVWEGKSINYMAKKNQILLFMVLTHLRVCQRIGIWEIK